MYRRAKNKFDVFLVERSEIKNSSAPNCRKTFLFPASKFADKKLSVLSFFHSNRRFDSKFFFFLLRWEVKKINLDFFLATKFLFKFKQILFLIFLSFAGKVLRKNPLSISFSGEKREKPKINKAMKNFLSTRKIDSIFRSFSKMKLFDAILDSETRPRFLEDSTVFESIRDFRHFFFVRSWEWNDFLVSNRVCSIGRFFHLGLSLSKSKWKRKPHSRIHYR